MKPHESTHPGKQENQQLVINYGYCLVTSIMLSSAMRSTSLL
jgi:hypothetical protein